jgi:hypothetical protein
MKVCVWGGDYLVSVEPMNGVSALIRREFKRLPLFFYQVMLLGKMATYELRGRTSPDTKSVAILILAFPAS